MSDRGQQTARVNVDDATWQAFRTRAIQANRSIADELGRLVRNDLRSSAPTEPSALPGTKAPAVEAPARAKPTSVKQGHTAGTRWSPEAAPGRPRPPGLLSVGTGGWVQIANFVVAGVLILGCAVGVRQVLRRSRAGTWGPVLLALTGLAFVWGGVFTSDPSLGFPPGTPEGIPDHQSWHSALHQASPVVAFAALAMACLVFARRFLGMQRRGWMLYSILTPIVAFIVTSRATSGDEFDFRYLLAGLAVLLAWLSGLAATLLRDPNT